MVADRSQTQGSDFMLSESQKGYKMTTYKFFMCVYLIIAIVALISGADAAITIGSIILGAVCKATNDILEAVRKVNNKL